jgi:peroxiredoxin
MKNIFSILAFLSLVISINVHAQTQQEVGSKAPLFSSFDQNGNAISLQTALEKGPVILSFYRGSWCRFCAKQMKEMQARYSEITDKNAQIILITPDLESGIQKTVDLVKPDFKIIRDHDLKIAYEYQVISDEKYNSFKGDLGDGKKFIPVPATYVIGQDGEIKYSYFDKNYRVRASFDEIIKSLDN